MSQSGYAAAAMTVPWLLADVESALEKRAPRGVIDARFVLDACGTRVPTHDQMAVAINGLLDLGVLRPTPGGYLLNAERLQNTQEYRRGFRDGLAAAASTNDESVTLCI